MNIAIVQTRPVRGDIDANIEDHKRFVVAAAGQGADAIVFPELSITGYEPGLAKQLATDAGDSRFNIFEELSIRYNIDIGVGMPLLAMNGINISMIIFSPGREREIYSKQYLHQDEEPFFVAGKKGVLSFERVKKLSLAICYELSVAEHAEGAFKIGSKIYVASVAKTLAGVENAVARLAGIAKRYSMVVVMSNCAGHCEDFECGGGSAAWNSRGELIGQLDRESEGMMVVDTFKEELVMSSIGI
jgi:predicted amidohydrolase